MTTAQPLLKYGRLKMLEGKNVEGIKTVQNVE